MSAFFDIWVGLSKPKLTRLDNKDWYKKNDSLQNYFYSNPNGGKFQFLEEYSTATHHLTILGQFYESIEKNELLERCVNYIDLKTTSFEDPSGHYILLLLNKSSRQYHVFTNRFGTYHAYYRTEKDNNAISTYYWELAKNTEIKSLDWTAISGFFSMGFFPDDTTYLKSIKIFKPASYYKFDENLNLLESARYWQWYHTVSDATLKDHIAQLDIVLNRSLSSALTGKNVALPISGGLDSRTLAGSISKNRNIDSSSVWAYSYGFTSDSIEINIAEKIANRCDFSFDSYVVPQYLFDSVDLITDSVELFQYIDGTRQACMKNSLVQHADVVVGGHWGDIWMDSMGLSILNAENEKDILLKAFHKKIIKKGHKWLLSAISDQFVTNTNEYLDDYFTSYIDQYSHIEDVDFRMKIFKTDQWSFRWTLASIRMYQAAVMPVLPFYDKHIAELFMTVPSHMVKDRKLQIEYLKQYYPAIAKVKWQEYNSNLYLYKWLNNRNILYRGVKKAQRSITGKKPVLRNAEFFYRNPTGKRNLEEYLLKHNTLNDITSTFSVKNLLNDYYEHPNAENNYAVSMLHTFSRFLDKVF